MSTARRTISFSVPLKTFLKRIGYLALLGILAVITIPDMSSARLFRAFGPENFLRPSSGPATEVRQFRVQYPGDSEFDLHVFYGGLKKDFEGVAPSALITLNGRNVVGPKDFNRNNHYIKKPVTLSETNSLSVELRGKPGSGVRVVITGKNDEPQVFDFSKAVKPDGIELLGLDLNYIWTIVDQPEDGKATLSDPLSSSTSLSVDRPGEYSLLLTISGATWKESFPINLTATAYPPTIPVPVETRIVFGYGSPEDFYSPDYAISVGTHTYLRPAASSCGSPGNSGFEVLVLDRGSLDVKDHKSFNIPCGSQAMADYLSGLNTTYGNGVTVIVSSLSDIYTTPSSVCGGLSTCPLGRALEALGGTTVFSSNYNNTNWINYSLIGIPGLGASNGYELNSRDHRAFYAGDPRINADILGYFIRDINQKWMFTYPDFVKIETRPQPTDGGNVIRVGNASYISEPLKSGAAGGFQVLILDRDTMTPTDYPMTIKTNATFSTNAGTGPGSTGDLEQQAMYNHLTILNDVALDTPRRFVVIIASIGPTPITYKAAIFNDLIRLIADYYGGTTGILYKLGAPSSTDPTIISTYSLLGLNKVGAAKYGLGAVEAVEESASKQNLQVVMHKDKQGWYGPATTYTGSTDLVSSPEFDLLSVALQPPVAWPIPNPADPAYAQQLAAYQYISSHLGEGLDQLDIRSCYTQSPRADWQSNCNILEYSKITPAPNFTQAVFDQMKTQLCDPNYGEINYINHANIFLADMDTLLTSLQLGSQTRLTNVYNMVKSTINIDETDIAKWDGLIVVRGMLKIASALDPEPVSSATMGALNSLLWLGMHLSTTPAGPPYTSINTQVLSLATEMNNIWLNDQKGKNIILDMIRTDWGKLEYVGKKLMSDWAYGKTDTNIWEDAAIDSLESSYFQSLIPTVWKIDYMQDTWIASPVNFKYAATSPYGGNPFDCQPYCNGSRTNATAYELLTFASSDHTWYVLEDEIVREGNTTCGEVHYDRSASLRDILFNTGDWYDSNNVYLGQKLGLQRPVFYERWIPSSSYTHFIKPTGGEPAPESKTCSD